MMDEMMNNSSFGEYSSVDLDQLLRSKAWDQLSGDERAAALKVLSGREEYERMQALVHQLKATAGVHDAAMKPSRDVREYLLKAFDAEQRKRKAGWWTNVSLFLNETIRFDVPAVRIAVATVLVVAVVFGALRLRDTDGQQPPIAKQETKESAPADPGTVTPVPPGEQPANTPPQPENNVAQSDEVIAPANTPQIVQQPSPFIPDTQNNQLVFGPDTLKTLNLCCGTSNGTIISTPESWISNANNNIAITNGLPARSRSLAEDAAVMDVFFAVK